MFNIRLPFWAYTQLSDELSLSYITVSSNGYSPIIFVSLLLNFHIAVLPYTLAGISYYVSMNTINFVFSNCVGTATTSYHSSHVRLNHIKPPLLCWCNHIKPSPLRHYWLNLMKSQVSLAYIPMNTKT